VQGKDYLDGTNHSLRICDVVDLVLPAQCAAIAGYPWKPSVLSPCRVRALEAEKEKEYMAMNISLKARHKRSGKKKF